jgi:lysyl-tRNA synthetase class I
MKIKKTYRLKYLKNNYYLLGVGIPNEYYYDNFIKNIRNTNGAEYSYAEHIFPVLASTEKLGNLPLLNKKEIEKILNKDKFRVGKNQGRAILYVETGHEFIVFPQGKEEYAKEYCDYLNKKHLIANDCDYIEKLALEKYPVDKIFGIKNDKNEIRRNVFIETYKLALEDNSHKKWSDKDLKDAYEGVLQNVGTSVQQSNLPSFDEYLEYKNNKPSLFECEVEATFFPISPFCKECGNPSDKPCTNTLCENKIPKLNDNGYLNILDIYLK